MFGNDAGDIPLLVVVLGDGGSSHTTPTNVFLLESGDDFLLESGGTFLLEG